MQTLYLKTSVYEKCQPAKTHRSGKIQKRRQCPKQCANTNSPKPRSAGKSSGKRWPKQKRPTPPQTLAALDSHSHIPPSFLQRHPVDVGPSCPISKETRRSLRVPTPTVVFSGEQTRHNHGWTQPSTSSTPRSSPSPIRASTRPSPSVHTKVSPIPNLPPVPLASDLGNQGSINWLDMVRSGHKCPILATEC